MSDIKPRIAIRYAPSVAGCSVRPGSRRNCFRPLEPSSARWRSRPGTGGVFEITYDGEAIWERKANGGFRDAKALKRRVRDRLDPARDLGHIDRNGVDEDGE
jgi:selenoprotein W-related protein